MLYGTCWCCSVLLLMLFGIFVDVVRNRKRFVLKINLPFSSFLSSSLPLFLSSRLNSSLSANFLHQLSPLSSLPTYSHPFSLFLFTSHILFPQVFQKLPLEKWFLSRDGLALRGSRQITWRNLPKTGFRQNARQIAHPRISNTPLPKTAPLSVSSYLELR